MAMIDRLRGARLLKGYRGSAPSDLRALSEAIQALGRIAVERPDIREIDVNPLVVLPEGHGAYALDALIVLDRNSAI